MNEFYTLEENIDIEDGKINNVYDACQLLAQRIEDEKAKNETMYSDPTKELGELHRV